MDISIDEPGSRGARWVCPNDRHLALRAKLRTGWSVKTGSLDSRWSTYPGTYSGGANRCRQSFMLSEEERLTIVQVIQRAEALDLSEQERVGRLVERLENMKRNVCMVTTNRSNERRSCGTRCLGGARCVCACALCGEKFGAVLGASASLCKDCRKYICQKCGIEAGNAMMPPLIDVSTSQRGSMQRIVQRSTSKAQKQFLCRICAETREMWKKSGAWFFKGMPKYILPEKKERGWSRTPHRTSAWTISGTSKSLESAEPQDSSSDEDATRRLAVARGQCVSSINLHRDNSCSKTSFSTSNQTMGGSSRLQGNRDESPYLGSTDKLGKSTLSIPSQCRRLTPSNSTTTLRSRSGGKSPNGSHNEQRVSFVDPMLNDEKGNDADDDEEDDDSTRESGATDRSKSSQVQSVRRDSSMSTSTTISSSPMERMPEQQRSLEKNLDPEWNRSCSDQESFSSSRRTSSQTELRQQTSNSVQVCGAGTRQDYGTLEVSLRYDAAAQCLQCKVERARGLRPMDIHGLADPFCKLNILPLGQTATTKRLRTKTVHKSCNPEFNEILNFYGTTENDLGNGKALHILILQDDPVGQDFLGEARFLLYELQPYQTKHYNVSLQDRYPVDREEETWGASTNGRGQIQITLSYCTRRRALLVTVHRAMNLLPMDSNGFSDPFVKLCLIEEATDNHRQQRAFDNLIFRASIKKLTGKKVTSSRNVHNTSVKWKTLNPEWNEEFAFGTRLTDLTKLTLSLSLWDKDFGKSNDYLGGLILGCNSKGARLRHWIDAIKFPDHRHRAWHDLTEMVVPLE